MRYSLLITDNMALDSTTEALQTYASADLHYFRDQADSALRLLEILDVAYQEHPIHDEALFLRAKIHAEQNEPEQAVVLWERVHQEHGEGILADDALFAQADVLQQELGRQDEAMALYQELFTRYTDSFFAAEARKRYRQLRGDQNN
jgi:TolA-binding protein